MEGAAVNEVDKGAGEDVCETGECQVKAKEKHRVKAEEKCQVSADENQAQPEMKILQKNLIKRYLKPDLKY
ncbi:hypothetical protein RIF29_28630 [Crotalaria pallida]|uniref:Uncharacterized protein n=1 Tax=Crotalaria pallida TaxID=3830 RepID=A0AAN9ED57_CROPI